MERCAVELLEGKTSTFHSPFVSTQEKLAVPRKEEDTTTGTIKAENKYIRTRKNKRSGREPIE
jgi:hypothetical protein